MADEELPQDFQKIRILIGALDAAVWKRINASEEGASKAFLRVKNDVYPRSAEEAAIWKELTSPSNHESLHRFVSYWQGKAITDYAMKLYDALVAESDTQMSK